MVDMARQKGGFGQNVFDVITCLGLSKKIGPCLTCLACLAFLAF